MQSHENPNSFLYEKIYAELKAEILAGAYAKGDWFPPERVLKDRFGTTHLTVRSALAKLVQEGYIERYSGKGTLVIYSKSGPASSQAPLRFTSAHLILANMDEEGAMLLDALEAQLRRISLPLSISLHRGDPELEQRLSARAVEAKALIILLPVETQGAPPRAEGDMDNRILIVRGGEGSSGACILIDDESGARDAVRYLLDLGHRGVALAAPASGASGLRRGWSAALAAAGLEGDEQQLTCVDAVETAREAVSAFLRRHPSCAAVLCGSDRIAAGACLALRAAGRQAGKDAAVVGYGNTSLSESLDLASIDPRLASVGGLVAAAISDCVRVGRLSSQTQAIRPRLVIRDSCCRWPPPPVPRGAG